MTTPTAAPAASSLAAGQVRRRCDPESLPAEVGQVQAHPSGLIGQERAAEALAFGLAMKQRGFNIFTAGPPGTGKSTAVRRFLESAARAQPTPSDWCYVHNFREPTRPRALRLPPGQGRRLCADFRHLLQAARREIPRAFESEEFIARREASMSQLSRRREHSIGQLSARAQSMGFTLQPTPMGIALLPVMGSRPLTEEDLAGLRPEMREVIDRNRELLETEARAFLKDMRAAERETREQLEEQERQVALEAVGGLVEDLADDYVGHPEVSTYLDGVREGILADIALFRSHPLPADGSLPEAPMTEDPRHAGHERAFRKYEVNVVVDNSDLQGAPVVLESNPTYANLLGRIEREAVFGALVTDFTLISSGALHRANGGFLMLRAEDLLRAPLAWEGLKRSLRENEIEIEDLGEALGLTSTRGLRPDAIPLEVKVVILGSPVLYHLLFALDPDFRELFKVRADFDVEMDRTPENEAIYGAFVAGCLTPNGRPAGRDGVARLIEESSRLVGDQQKLSTRFAQIADLVREADHWAEAEGAAAIGAHHVRKAVEQRIYRSALVQERIRELIARGVLLVRPEGSAVGQVTGLAYIELGEVPFGRPCRITATVGAGREGVVDIERQAELGGRIHSKGVLILSGYLAEMYARDKPLALSARLVFEQSYEEVEGDSASLAELLALLSCLAETPLRQGLAVTGSVNQHREVQAVGGVNEKIEGFFDTCRALGLTGDQGAILPAANVQHLMLRDDVVEAVSAGSFHVYPVATVDQALELLTGLPAGPRLQDGTFSTGGVHARVDARLRSLASALRAFEPKAEAAEPGKRKNGRRWAAQSKRTTRSGDRTADR